jgi:urease accessory protein UreF
MSDTVIETPKVSQVVEKYIALRNKKAEMKAAYDASVKEIDDALERVENFLLKQMQETGVDTFGSSAGVAYKSTKTSATVADWDATLKFIRDNQEWSALERRINKEFVKAYKEANNDLPPGVNWREEVSVNVRKK